MASSDTIVMGGVPKGSFVINRDSSVANKEIIDEILKNQKPVNENLNTETILVGDGEAIVDNETVKEYGMNFMMALNQKPKAHENIDSLIALSQLENMQGFKRGGYVGARGMTMKRPRGGNPTSMMGYEDGGYIKKYEDGNQVPPQDPRDLPTNTGVNQGMISPFWGDQPPIPPAWMEPATEMVKTPEEAAQEAAVFQNHINKMMIEEALKQARANGEQVEPVEIRLPEEYPLQTIDRKMQNRIQFPVVQEKNPMSNLGRSWIDR